MQIAEHVAAWTASASPSGDKISTLRGLAQELYQRRPLLYVQGSTSPISAQVVLRSVRKPSVSALAKAPAATASLFKTPTNTTIVIKFHPQFGYAGQRSSSMAACHVCVFTLAILPTYHF
jgi:hypothetical protein